MPILLLVFFLSGASALAYQVIWIRLFGLVFGGTVLSMSVVIAVFMGGLAIGSHLFGQYAMRVRNRVRLYGMLEISLGVLAILVYWAITNLSTLIYSLPFDADSRTVAGVVARMLLALVILVLPTMIMGGSLPILVSAVTNERKKIMPNTSLLYAVNTLGAMVGALMVGIVLVRYLGVFQTNVFAAGINICMGLVAVWVSGTFSSAPESTREEVRKEIPATGESGRRYLVTLAITGFVGLALEMAWMRMLLLVYNNTVYLYTILLTMYLFALGLGGLVARYFVPSRAHSERLLGILLAGVALTTGIGYVCYPWIITFVFKVGYEFYSTFYGISFVNAATFFMMGFIPVFLMGVSFPIGLSLFASEIKGLSGRLGMIYAVNTAGSLVGSLASVFVIIPNIGIRGTVALCVLLTIAPAMYFLSRERDDTTVRKLIYPIAVASVVVLIATLSVQVIERVLSRSLTDRQEITYLKEGPSSTIWISGPRAGLRDNRKIWMDNVWISSTSNEGTHALLAHYPILFSSNPRSVAGIAFGTGQTFGTCLLYPVERMVCVEIDNEVITAVRGRFDDENYGVMNDPRTEIVIDDGRFFLQGTSDTFDIVTAEPLQPYTRGTVNLYSREFYQACLNVLNPGGMVAQWLPLYNSGYSDTWSMIHTFADVFPHVLLFLNENDGILLGSDQPITVDPSQVLSERVRADLKRIENPDIYSLIGNYVCSREKLMEVARHFPIITDNKPTLEYTAPISQWEEEITGPVRMRQAFVEITEPVDEILSGEYDATLARAFQQSRTLISMGYVQEKIARDDEAFNLYLRAYRTNPNDIKAIWHLFKFLRLRNRLSELPPELQFLRQQPGN